MVDVAQWLEHWIVVPGVVGSIPIFHPKSRKNQSDTQVLADFVLYTYAFKSGQWAGRGRVEKKRYPNKRLR